MHDFEEVTQLYGKRGAGAAVIDTARYAASGRNNLPVFDDVGG